MAARDFMPFRSPLGGTYEVRHAGFTANETFDVGEPINIDDSGVVVEGSAANWVVTDSDSAVLGGIACNGPGAGNINPQTGTTYAVNDAIAYWPWNQGTLFITNGGSACFKASGASGAGAEAAPLVTDIGESYEMSNDGTNWCIEKTAGGTGTDVEALIVDVLDISKAPIRLSGNAGFYAVFEITATLAAA